MINTGPGERRTTWQQSVLVMHGGWRRTRSPCEPPSWSGRTPRWGSKWLSWGRIAVAARTPWLDMRLSTALCKELQPEKCQWEKSRTPFPAEFNTDTNIKGIYICCLCWPLVTVSSSSFLIWCWSFGRTLAGKQGTMGSVVTGRSVESAWLLHSDRMIVDTPVVTWKIWSDLKKVRRCEKSRVVDDKHRLLNSTQISFYHCIALVLSGPKHE